MPSGRRLVIDAALFRALWDAGTPAAEMARRLGFCRAQAVHIWARANKIPPRPPAKAKPPAGREAEFRALWLAGTPVAEMAARFGYASAASVHKAKRRMGLPPRSDEGALERRAAFVKLWMAGVSAREMAKTLGYASYTSVNTAAKNWGLPPRKHGVVQVVAPVVKAPVPVTAPARRVVALTGRGVAPLADPAAVPDDLAREVLATRGRYAALQELAVRHGMTATRLQQLWHRVRRAA